MGTPSTRLLVDAQGLYPIETRQGCLPQSGSNGESIQGQRALQVTPSSGGEVPPRQPMDISSAVAHSNPDLAGPRALSIIVGCLPEMEVGHYMN
ncbi:hypothetical protein Cadr_000013329 [Camelus dromedarius]|uniref:Uncharacterized protein n=1 Tax=Camelus dromedarius TaxID=9838 RepID=A0A5N4DBL1_CAMDR|nr:hypothetical protein Cadr_000013329 [Camelus dromedarius]